MNIIKEKNGEIVEKVKNLQNVKPLGLMKEIVDNLVNEEEIPETEFLQNVSDAEETELVSYTVEGIADYIDDESKSEEFDRFEAKERERRAKNPEYAKHQQEIEEVLAFVDTLG